MSKSMSKYNLNSILKEINNQVNQLKSYFSELHNKNNCILNNIQSMFGKLSLIKQKDKKDKKKGYYIGKYTLNVASATVGLATSTWKFLTKKNKKNKKNNTQNSLISQIDRSLLDLPQDISKVQKPLFHSQISHQQQHFNQADNENDELFQLMLCPISQEIMKHPMIIAKCGHNFQRKEIQLWLQKHNKCPLCNTEISKEDLKFNFQLKQIIQIYLKQKQKSNELGKQQYIQENKRMKKVQKKFQDDRQSM